MKFTSCAAAVFLATASVSAAPLNKRIAQNIPESTAQWEQACLAAGGGLQCNPLSVKSFTTLLAAAGPCEQQNAADEMIDLAKQLGNNGEMIRLTQIFTQQPRNSPNSVSVLYCQQAPRNSELSGLFQCQFEGVKPTTFTDGSQVGAPGTIPFGLSGPVSPPRSCPAHTDGGIPDGQQLVNFVQSPGTPNNVQVQPPQQVVQDPAPVSPDNGVQQPITVTVTAPGSCEPTPVPAPAPESNPVSNPAPADNNNQGTPPPDAKPFTFQNGKDAQALNAHFKTLDASSPCTDGENACVNGEFAQCVSGSFVLTPCGSIQCFALPLVNKAGTSITCDTAEDAAARIAATGVTGGIDGSQ